MVFSCAPALLNMVFPFLKLVWCSHVSKNKSRIHSAHQVFLETVQDTIRKKYRECSKNLWISISLLLRKCFL